MSKTPVPKESVKVDKHENPLQEPCAWWLAFILPSQS